MTIEQLPSGSYRIKQMYEGKTYSVTVKYKPTQKEAIRLLTERMNEFNVSDTKSRMLFSTAAKKFIESKENKADVVITDFNNWIATGELKKDNYKVFDKKTGKTIATISKKYASASSYSVECEFDSNEPIVTIMTILIDLIY